MKKPADKIALVAVIILGFIAIILAIIFPMLATGWVLGTNDVLFITIAVLYTGVSIYLLWSVFSSAGNVKTLTLFADKESTTKTSLRVIKSLVIADARRIRGAAVKRVRVSQRDNGIRLSITLTVVGAEVEETVDTMRCLVADTFIKVLGVRFDYIDFKIEKVRPNYIANEATARKRAQILKNERKCSDKYHDEAMDPIFEQAEKERDLAEEQNAERVTMEKRAQEEEKKEGQAGQEEEEAQEESARYEASAETPTNEERGGFSKESRREARGKNHGKKGRARGKKGKMRKIKPPAITGESAEQEHVYDDAEKISAQELKNGHEVKEEQLPAAKIIDSGDFTIADEEEDKE